MSVMSKYEKVCFVSMDNLNRVPYIEKYIEWLNAPFDVIYWDRSGINDSVGETHSFRYEKPIKAAKDGANKLQKLFGYIGFRKFASRILENADYRLVFTLTGNCAVLLSKPLLSKYRGRFVIDIRDYWHEDFALYHNREQQLIKESALAVISSPAYAGFLCNHDYLIMHNDQSIDSELIAKYRSKNTCSNPFVISCIGAMKNPEYDKKVIDYFANDNRFLLKFIGRGYDLLQDYVSSIGANNVYLQGAFPMAETMRYYEDADAILNMYGNHTPYFDYALSNKLYFAARLALPILVCPDTAMESYSTDNGFGITVDLEDCSCKDAILASYSPMAIYRRLSGSESFLKQVEIDNLQTRESVSRVLFEAIV